MYVFVWPLALISALQDSFLAHQNPDLPINFNIKMGLVKDLSEALQVMGKQVKVSYF